MWIYVYTCIYAKYVYCSIFGLYTFIYDIQFHIRAYTDMQVHWCGVYLVYDCFYIYQVYTRYIPGKWTNGHIPGIYLVYTQDFQFLGIPWPDGPGSAKGGGWAPGSSSKACWSTWGKPEPSLTNHLEGCATMMVGLWYHGSYHTYDIISMIWTMTS